jgi:hypothetical protein
MVGTCKLARTSSPLVAQLLPGPAMPIFARCFLLVAASCPAIAFLFSPNHHAVHACKEQMRNSAQAVITENYQNHLPLSAFMEVRIPPLAFRARIAEC